MYTDIPQRDEIDQLAQSREAQSVTLQLPTSPLPSNMDKNRLEFSHLIAEALALLSAQGAPKAETQAVEGLLRDLHGDTGFWRTLASSLVVFVTPKQLRSYRLPNVLPPEVFVGTRFRIVPLLRTHTFPHTAYVLALSKNTAQLIDISPEHAAREIPLENLPANVMDALNVDNPAIDAPRQRLFSPEGQTERINRFTRAVDRTIAPLVRGGNRPVILAGTTTITGVYRQVSSLHNILEAVIEGSPDRRSLGETDELARQILDDQYRQESAALRQRFEERRSAGQGVVDLSDIARAAVQGAVDQLIVELDYRPEGRLDEETGAIISDELGSDSVIDAIAARTLSHGGTVRVLHAGEVPSGSRAVATVRFSA